MPAPYRYTSDEEDSARWLGFPFRGGDVRAHPREDLDSLPAVMWHLSDAWLKSSAAFFRRGTSGAGREILTDDEIAGHARLAAPRRQFGLVGAYYADGAGYAGAA